MNTKAKAGWFVLIRDVVTHELLSEFGPYESEDLANLEAKALAVSGKTYANVVGRRY